MKTTGISLILLLTSSMALAADNAPELKNGDFENGKQFWKGEGKVVVENEATNAVNAEKAGQPKPTPPPAPTSPPKPGAGPGALKPGAANGGNKVWELKASERNSDTLSQDVDLGKNMKVQVTLRAKGIQYKGAGLRISMRVRGGGYTFYDYEVSDNQWNEIKFNYSRNGSEPKYTIILSPMVGKGSIQIDDVKIGLPSANSKEQ